MVAVLYFVVIVQQKNMIRSIDVAKTLPLTIGADPEVFLKSTKDGSSLCAHGVIPGNKKKPYLVPHGAVQVDGMALEFNITPAKNQKEFVRRINLLKRTLSNMIPTNTTLDIKPVAYFDEQTWASAPEEAKVLGCEPDYDAWKDGGINPPPNPDVTFRTAAGHIHIGWANNLDTNEFTHKLACQMMVKQLDCSLFHWSVLQDDDNKRRELYGNPGAYRPKSYGVEYRVLSNFWLKNSELTAAVYAIVKKAYRDLLNGIRYYDMRIVRPSNDLSVANSQLKLRYFDRKFGLPEKVIMNGL
jgi:hypothetical protein